MKIPITLNGAAAVLMLDPDPSRDAAIYDRDERIVWCNPILWEYLSGLAAIMKPPRKRKGKKCRAEQLHDAFINSLNAKQRGMMAEMIELYERR